MRKEFSVFDKLLGKKRVTHASRRPEKQRAKSRLMVMIGGANSRPLRLCSLLLLRCQQVDGGLMDALKHPMRD